MNKMKKITALVCGLMFCAQTGTWAQIQTSKVGNVTSISSSFDYKDPAQMQLYLQKKAEQDAAKQNKDDSGAKDEGSEEKLAEPAAMFHIYINNDRFYKKNDSGKYSERIDISFTSHDMKHRYIFDKECSPYLIVNDGVNETVLKFKKFKFDNPYWISYALTPSDIELLNRAVSVQAVLPEAQEDIYEYNKSKQRMEKRDYDSKMQIAEMRYDIPAEILAEWKQVLSQSGR